jgi:hypothetical protein
MLGNQFEDVLDVEWFLDPSARAKRLGGGLAI